MATIRRPSPDELTIRIFIAEPLGFVAMPFMLVAAISGFFAGITLWGMINGSMEFAKAFPVFSLCLAVFIPAFYIAWTFSAIRFVFDRRANRITRLRGHVPVSSYNLDELERVRLDEYEDGDGGSGRVLLVFKHGNEVPVNPVRSGNTSELASFAKAVNEFLSDKAMQPSSELPSQETAQ